MAYNLLGSACDVLGIKDSRRAERSAHHPQRCISADRAELLGVVGDPIDDRDPVEANSLLPRHVAVAVS